MKKLVGFFLFIAAVLLPPHISRSVVSSSLIASSPYYVGPGQGEPDATVPSGPSFCDATGKTPVALSTLVGTKVLLIYTGQSLVETAANGSAFTSVNSTNLNYNMCDRYTYRCNGALLGTPWPLVLSANGNNIPCQVGDQLISAGTYANAIVATMAIGGTTCANWDVGGVIHQRITAFVNGLKARGLTPSTGFVGDILIMWHDGETDAQQGTAQGPLTTCLQSVGNFWSSAGMGAVKFVIAQESVVAQPPTAAVVNAEAAAVGAGCPTCCAGANWDSIAFNSANRQDGIHPSGAGAPVFAALDVARIQAIKSGGC